MPLPRSSRRSLAVVLGALALVLSAAGPALAASQIYSAQDFCVITGVRTSCKPVQWCGPGPSEDYSYSWTGPNGFAATSPCIDATVTGTYTLTVRRNSDGATETCSADFLFTPGDVPCGITGPSEICPGQSTELCGPDGDLEYHWEGPGGFTSSSQCVIVSATGVYTLVTRSPSSRCEALCTHTLALGDCPGPECVVPGSIDANFNGTSVVGVGTGPAFIWFNSNLSTKGMTAGSSIFLTDSKVFIDGVGHDVPDAKITFAAVACATTTFDTGTNTWLTTVPLAGSDEIFLSGLAFPVTNLPGGARVSWQGNFATDQRGICLSWKWGAAAYRFFTTSSTSPLVIDYNAANIKPTHQGACLINNSNHAGTPQNSAIRATVTGGARGGGGSNFTGSWSGTGSLCPECPPESGSESAAALRSVAPESSAPVEELSFAAPLPNPTRGPTTMRFTLPRAGKISLDVYDVSGRWVRGLANGDFSAGTHTLKWDLLDRSGRPVSRGIYFVRLATEGRVLSRPVIAR